MSLRLERDGAIGRLLLDRAGKRNAITQAMWQELPLMIARAMADDAIRVVILGAAAPGAFCAGADIEEFAAGADDPAWRTANQEAIRAAQTALARAPKPVIALIEGDCVGAGCGLAIACDIRVAAPEARFGITPAKLGLVYPLHDTKLLVDLVGPGQAKRMLFTAGLIDACEAHRIGLVEMLSEYAAGEARALAEKIAGVSAHSIVQAKAIIRRILDGQPDDDEATAALFAQAFAGADFREGVAAFRARRAPRFG